MEFAAIEPMGTCAKLQLAESVQALACPQLHLGWNFWQGSALPAGARFSKCSARWVGGFFENLVSVVDAEQPPPYRVAKGKNIPATLKMTFQATATFPEAPFKKKLIVQTAP